MIEYSKRYTPVFSYFYGLTKRREKSSLSVTFKFAFQLTVPIVTLCINAINMSEDVNSN